MEIVSSYNLIIEFSVIIILSFLFNGISKRTNIPAVLMLISLGIILQYILQYFTSEPINFFPILEVLGIVGLIMIVLEAALELELKREKLVPILKSLAIALISLLLSTWAAANILYYYIPEMSMQSAWLYATPLSILSSAIIIPSVAGLKSK
ncbi:cation:proton antiporter, partial [Algoriphagus sp.]